MPNFLIQPWKNNQPSLSEPWMHEKFIKKQTYASEKAWKCQKNLIKKIKNISKKLCYKNQLLKYENDIKSTCNPVKEVVGLREFRSPFSNKVIVDNAENTDSLRIAEKFNNIFANIVKLAFKRSSIKYLFIRKWLNNTLHHFKKSR